MTAYAKACIFCLGKTRNAEEVRKDSTETRGAANVLKYAPR